MNLVVETQYVGFEAAVLARWHHIARYWQIAAALVALDNRHLVVADCCTSAVDMLDSMGLVGLAQESS